MSEGISKKMEIGEQMADEMLKQVGQGKVDELVDSLIVGIRKDGIAINVHEITIFAKALSLGLTVGSSQSEKFQAYTLGSAFALLKRLQDEAKAKMPAGLK